jgi:hypothetical protein
VTEYRLIVALGVALVVLALTTMLAAHEHHYKDRRWRLLEARLNALESIVTEDRRT